MCLITESSNAAAIKSQLPQFTDSIGKALPRRMASNFQEDLIDGAPLKVLETVERDALLRWNCVRLVETAETDALLRWNCVRLLETREGHALLRWNCVRLPETR